MPRDFILLGDVVADPCDDRDSQSVFAFFAGRRNSIFTVLCTAAMLAGGVSPVVGAVGLHGYLFLVLPSYVGRPRPAFLTECQYQTTTPAGPPPYPGSSLRRGDLANCQNQAVVNEMLVGSQWSSMSHNYHGRRLDGHGWTLRTFAGTLPPTASDLSESESDGHGCIL